MRGISIAVAGIAIMLISLVAMAIINATGASTSVAILFYGDLAYSAAHEVALYRSIIPASAESTSAYAASNIAKAAGVWDQTTPSIMSLRTTLERRSSEGLLTGKLQTSAKEREISFAAPVLAVKDYSVPPCDKTAVGLILSTCFNLTGKQDFTMTDSRLRATISSSAPIQQKVNSSFFTLASLGREQLDNGYWIIAGPLVSASGDVKGVQGELGQRCKGIELDPTPGGYMFNMAMEDLPGMALICGYGTYVGLATVTDWTGQGTRVNNIVRVMNETLNYRYSTELGNEPGQELLKDMRFDITVESFTGSDEEFSAVLKWNITDTNKVRYVGDEPLSLVFKTETKWP
jgi:hypothetical protein